MEKFNLSPNFKCFCSSTPDNKLQFFDTDQNNITQECIIPSYLSSKISVIKWAWPKSDKGIFRNKKKSAHKFDVSDLVAIGFQNGLIYIYSYLNCEIIGKLENGHADVVNDLCWDNDNSYLFSCSNDNNIIIWDVNQSKLFKKWKADDYGVQSISLTDDGKYLLTASRNIKLWHIESLQIVQNFVGHIESINYLKNFSILHNCDPISPSNMSITCKHIQNGPSKDNYHKKKKKFKINGLENNNLADDIKVQNGYHRDSSNPVDPNDHDIPYFSSSCNYFVSASFSEDIVKAWNANISEELNKDKALPIASFATSSAIKYVDILIPQKFQYEAASSYLAVVLKNGYLNIFSTHINGHRINKPLYPQYSIAFKRKFITPGNNSANDTEATITLPIIFAKLDTEISNTDTSLAVKIHLGYGNLVRNATNSSNMSKSPDKKRKIDGLKVNKNEMRLDHCRPILFESMYLSDLKESENIYHRNLEILPKFINTSDDQISEIKTVIDAKASMTLCSRIKEILAEKHQTPYNDGQHDKTPILQNNQNITTKATTENEKIDQNNNNNRNMIPKANSLATLIIQYLQSGDQTKLWNILYMKTNFNVIKETVMRIPLKWLSAFIFEIGNRLSFCKTKEMKCMLLWFDNIMLYHSSYIISTPELYRRLFAIQELLSERTSYMPKMLRLKGIINQTKLQAQYRTEDIESRIMVNQIDRDSHNLIHYEDSDSELEEMQL
ncbi:unnamed protein product [Gordionus sp. m RMFG-2023]